MARFSYRSARRAGRRFRRRAVRRPRRMMTTRRRFYKRSNMTSRKVRNLAATKKHDTMRVWNYNSSTTPYVELGPAITSFLWLPTARYISFEGNQSHKRSKSKVFMRGLSETRVHETNDGTTWQWRRIVFETKGIQDSDAFYYDNAIGYTRLMRSQGVGPQAQTAGVVFAGVSGSDWTSMFTASVDRNAIKVHSDVTRIIRSGNESGIVKRSKTWDPFNKTFIYNDDESGESKASGAFASLGNFGMGDIYVWDLYKDISGASDSRLVVRPQATLYWHE